MGNTINFNIGVDSDILKQCEAMYGELGVDLNTAINVFLNKSLCVGGFPFDINKETMAAMLEAECIVCDPFVKQYSDVGEALKVLKE
jgi:DNA-damage-inducible protein J